MIAKAAEEDSIYLSLLVACHNEEANLPGTLDSLLDALRSFDFSWEILIVDDASTDGTRQVAEAYIQHAEGLPIRLIVNRHNQGLAQSYIDGAFLAQGQYYRLVCGDNVEPAETFNTIFARIGEADVIIPYPERSINRTRFRLLLSRLYTRLVCLITGHRIHYFNGLPIFLRRDVMRWHTNYYGFGFQADMVARMLDLNRSYVQVPVTVTERQAGASNALKMKNILSVGHTLFDLLVRRISREIYPERRQRSEPAEIPRAEIADAKH